jgi:hypothetical protein
VRSAARPGCCCLLLPAACARSTGRAGAARTGEGGMSGIKNSTPVQRVTAPGEQGQVAHPHSAGSTPGPSRALAPLRQAPGAFASHPSVGSRGANRRAWRGASTGPWKCTFRWRYSAQPAQRPCRMRYACVVLQFFAPRRSKQNGRCYACVVLQ